MKTIEDLDKGTIRRIDWQELFPGVLLFRSLTLAFRVFPILAGTILIAFFSWKSLIDVFTTPLLLPEKPLASAPENPTGNPPGEIIENGEIVAGNAGNNELSQKVPSRKLSLLPGIFLDGPRRSRNVLIDRIAPSPQVDEKITFGKRVLILLIWILFALFMARKSALRLASTERSPLGETLRFTLRRFGSVLLAGAIPLVGIALGRGILYLLSFLGGIWAGIVSPFTLIVAFLTVLIQIGLQFGFPLMVAAVAVDRCDGFDAFSRVFSYLVQRPFHAIFYGALACFFGAVGFHVVHWITSLTLQFVQSRTDLGSSTGGAIFFFSLLHSGFLVTYSITAATAIYLILRKSVDGIAFYQFAKASPGEPHRLKPILSDAQGAPVMAGDEDSSSDGSLDPTSKNRSELEKKGSDDH